MTSSIAHPVVGHPVPDDGVLAALRPWVTRQRWYPAKGAVGAIERVVVIELRVDDPAEVTVHVLRLPSGGLLQVPVVRRPDDGRERSSVIGTLADGSLLVDGCHDPAFWRAWLGAAQPAGGSVPDRSGAGGTGPGQTGTDETSTDLAGADLAGTDLTGARVLGGEQSNTSVLLPSAAPPAILKVFRGLSAGPNPDVDVPLALARVGWRGVPRPLAWLTGAWGPQQSGHLGVLSELIVDADDGFELACRYAHDDEGFGDLTEPLGRTVAQMHRALREALPVGPGATAGHDARPDGPVGHDAGAVPTRTTRTTAALRRRAADAFAAAPLLADRAEAVQRVLDAVDRLTGLPAPQRVHGDLHLGQVLHSADRGWTVLDFEGEPQASPAERARPDLALRDLAGMLRSIDYAAAIGHAHGPHWARDARRRLVLGYQDEAGNEGSGPLGAGSGLLLRALELDKALYEVVYELRNRPDWVAIPLAGVDRLLAVDD